MRIRSAPLFEWLVNNGDSGAGRRSAAVLSSIAQDRAASVAERGYAVCMLGIAAGVRRDAAGVVRALDQLASSAAPTPASRAAADNRAFCLALLGGWRAAGEQRGNAGTLIARADSILVWSSMTIWELGSFAIGLAASDAGDLELARRSMGRENVQTPDDRLYYAAYLRERGRLALLAGDTREARQQWRYYLALREDVEPSVRAAVDSVRAALAKIAR